MSALLDQMAETASAATVTVVLSIPLFVEKSQFPSFLGQLVDRHASQLNDISKRVVRGRDSVTYFPFTPSNDLQPAGAHTYQRWAAGMAPTLGKKLGPRDSTSPRTEAVEESRRQATLDALGLVSMPEDTILNQITAIAQNFFDVSIAAVTFSEPACMSAARTLAVSACFFTKSRAASGTSMFWSLVNASVTGAKASLTVFSTELVSVVIGTSPSSGLSYGLTPSELARGKIVVT